MNEEFKKKLSLYGISQELYVLNDLIKDEEFDSETGELIDNSETIKQLYDEIKMDATDKLINTHKYTKIIDVENAVLQAEIDCFMKEVSYRKKKIKAKKNKKEILRQGMLHLLKLGNLQNVKTNDGTFYVSKSKSVNIINEELIERAYLKIKREVDKVAIKKAISEGVEVKGAEIVENESIGVR